MIKNKAQSIIDNHLNWLLLDAAQSPEALWYAKGANYSCISLFGDSDRALEEKGPWLINIENNFDFIQRVLTIDKLGHGALWFSSQLAIDILIEKLSKRLYAKREDNSETRFRYYDPRVLHPYLLYELEEHRNQFLSMMDTLFYAELSPFRVDTHWIIWQLKNQNYEYLSYEILLQEET